MWRERTARTHCSNTLTGAGNMNSPRHRTPVRVRKLAEDAEFRDFAAPAAKTLGRAWKGLEGRTPERWIVITVPWKRQAGRRDEFVFVSVRRNYSTDVPCPQRALIALDLPKKTPAPILQFSSSLPSPQRAKQNHHFHAVPFAVARRGVLFVLFVLAKPALLLGWRMPLYLAQWEES